MLRHLPNTLTVCRGLAGPLVLVLVLQGAHIAAFWVFLVAMASDMVDGWIARRLNATSRLALYLDPLADKVLTDVTWVALALRGFAPPELAIGMLLRDGLVIAAWLWGMPRGRSWAPRPMGQISVAFEAVALCVLLFHGPWYDVHWPTVGTVLGAIGLGLSTAQLLEYALVRHGS